MEGLWLEDQNLSFREDNPKPDPTPGEALIKMRLAGICSTSLELIKGYSPFPGVLGHEFVGEIVEAPQAEDLVGQCVVGEINAVCGSCYHCQSGRPTHSLHRTTLGISGRNGVFANFFTLPVENLYRISESVPDESAVFVEPLAAALEILEQDKISPTDRGLVVGAG